MRLHKEYSILTDNIIVLVSSLLLHDASDSLATYGAIEMCFD